MLLTTLIMPGDIVLDTTNGYDRQFMGHFGKYECECIAFYLVRRCQQLGMWVPITYKELWEIDQNEKYPMGEVMLYEGLEIFEEIEWFLITENGFELTDDFIERCANKRYKNAAYRD